MYSTYLRKQKQIILPLDANVSCIVAKGTVNQSVPQRQLRDTHYELPFRVSQIIPTFAFISKALEELFIPPSSSSPSLSILKKIRHHPYSIHLDKIYNPKQACPWPI